MVAARSALPVLRAMTESDVDAVMAIELAAYAFPWTPGIFADCLRAGYRAWLVERAGMVCAYGLLSAAAGEAHVLNVCVDPGQRRTGLARVLMARLLDDARTLGAQRVFLEVRPSNIGAVALYDALGFHLVSRRPNYYPAEHGREDALVMAMELLPPE
ncbi:MAG: ribosomal protein S18-alanine N-acetyltransferase [Xanthomonadales bacterium]|nr:ribosomal protein S18-alanine N-acetyltransferase [Xanthomonadales bacterium]